MKTSLKRIGWFEEKPLNLRLPLLYNAVLGEFSLVYAGTTYRARDQKALESQVREALHDHLHLEWVPVIEVRPVAANLFGFPQATQCGFVMNRKQVAQLPQGLGFKQGGWTVREHERLAASTQLGWDVERDGPFTPPCTMRGPGTPRLFLPYSEALWGRMEAIQHQMTQLQRRFFEVLATREGIERLVTPGMTLAETVDMPEVLR